MVITQILPIIFGVLALLFCLKIAVAGETKIKKAWLFPSALSFLFFAFSVYTMMQEGVFGFVPEHTGTFWENQITFDLVFAACVAWFFMVPKAKALGMNLLPWLVVVASTGSIGILAMVARLLYLQEKNERLSL